MKIFALTIGDNTTPSSWFRLYQYFPYLQQSGWEIETSPFAKRNEETAIKAKYADLVINQKNLFDRSFTKKLRNSSKHLIFDFDDAIYTRPGKPYFWSTQIRVNSRLKNQIKSADVITTSSNFLKDYALQYNSQVHVIPMAVDLNLWQKKTQFNEMQVTIGWIGAPHNLRYLEKLEPVLKVVLDKFPQVKIAVYSGKRPNWDLPTEYFPFQQCSEQEFVKSLDIGLLPLHDEPFTKGKSPIKAIQYMACAVPVVGDVFGATEDILKSENSIAVKSLDDWAQALETLILNSTLRQKLGEAGRLFIESQHNVEKTAAQLSNLFFAIAK